MTPPAPNRFLAPIAALFTWLHGAVVSTRGQQIVQVAEAISKLSIIVGVVIWLWEIPDRAQERIDAAWATVNAASGKPGNAGRSRALEFLNSKGVYLAGLDLSNAMILGIDLSHADLRAVNFDGADISLGRLGCSTFSFYLHRGHCGEINHASFRDACFDRTSFAWEGIDDSVFADSALEKTQRCLNPKHYNVDFSHAVIQGTTFRNIAFADVRFTQARIYRTVFDNSKFQDVEMDRAFFSGARLEDVDFTKTNLSIGDLKGATLCRVKLPDGNMYSNFRC